MCFSFAFGGFNLKDFPDFFLLFLQNGLSIHFERFNIMNYGFSRSGGALILSNYMFFDKWGRTKTSMVFENIVGALS